MVPGVENAADAKRIVDLCRYPPRGNRGAAGFIRAAAYGRDWPTYRAAADEDVMVICQIESRAAVDRIAEIAACGADSLFIGPLDL